jgi:hypothetical protein
MVYPPEGSLASALATLEGLECQTVGDWDVVLGEEQTYAIQFVPVWKPLFRVIIMIIWKLKRDFAANCLGYGLPSWWVELRQAMMFPGVQFGCSHQFGQQWSLWAVYA